MIMVLFCAFSKAQNEPILSKNDAWDIIRQSIYQNPTSIVYECDTIVRAHSLMQSIHNFSSPVYDLIWMEMASMTYNTQQHLIIKKVFTELGYQLTSNDTLFVFTTGHGGTNGGTSTYLSLWNDSIMTDSAGSREFTSSAPWWERNR